MKTSGLTRVIIRDANGNVQGNPKGYKDHTQAQKQIDNRLNKLLNDIADKKYPNRIHGVVIATCKWELV
jgi:ketopantoate hydroxymethyltransferase